MSALPLRAFGATGLMVPALGLGCGAIGAPSLSEAEVEALLLGAVDAGVTLLDTARSYGASEERIGRHLASRRGDIVLSTKVGYGVEGFADWTGPCVAAGVDAALRRLATDRIDVVHLHSCPLDVLQRGDVIEALLAAVRAGKVRVAAYSGENEELSWAVAAGAFDSVQASVNVCDQAALAGALAEASARGLGVIAKRPLANAPWRFGARPASPDAGEYWERFRALALDAGGLPWDEVALRFAAWRPGVAACVVGTADLGHLRRGVEAVARGPLPEPLAGRIASAFAARGASWRGVI